MILGVSALILGVPESDWEHTMHIVHVLGATGSNWDCTGIKWHHTASDWVYLAGGYWDHTGSNLK